MNLDMNILIVDDFETMRRIVKGGLKELGFYNFLEADDGKPALDILRKEKVDLIISDWLMPNMSGLELLKAVKEDKKLKEIPFIMVTAEGHKGNVLKAINAGVDNYIVKPFSPKTLQEKIKKVVK